MANINLTQAEADALIAMEKHRVTDDPTDFPIGGASVVLSLQSVDKREQFLLDLSRGRINLQKVKMQTRGRQVIVLVRLDLGGAPHRNPNGEEVPVPHLHVYREGYADKWAMPVPPDRFRAVTDVWTAFEDFMRFCNITRPPNVKQEVLT